MKTFCSKQLIGSKTKCETKTKKTPRDAFAQTHLIESNKIGFEFTTICNTPLNNFFFFFFILYGSHLNNF